MSKLGQFVSAVIGAAIVWAFCVAVGAAFGSLVTWSAVNPFDSTGGAYAIRACATTAALIALLGRIAVDAVERDLADD